MFVLGGGASQRQRDERLHRLTLLSLLLFSVLSFCLLLFSPFFSFGLRDGVCRVVRAQPCEHARDTAHALVLRVCLLDAVRAASTTTVFVVPTTHCSLLTIVMFTIEH